MIVGIDLGTTNSLVGYFQDGESVLVPNVFGDLLTPSVVGISDTGEVLVGKAAADRLVTHPRLTTAAFKRFMGSSKRIELGKKSFRPEELSALIIRSLIEDVVSHTGEEVTEAIISVPAYFNEGQRNATISAGKIAGLKVERLINEPTAAALAYGLNETDGESTFLVFDVGGGTFDVSILELFDGVMEVHASAGDNFLGGEDFLDALIGVARSKTQVKELTPNQLGQIRFAAEAAKRRLNTDEITSIKFQHGEETVEVEVTQAEYQEAIAPLLLRLRKPVEQALRDSKLRVGDLDEIVLVGGSTRKKHIQSLVAKMFGRLPLRHINPDEVVAHGAVVQAALKSRHEALEDVVLTDVCPYTLGVDVSQQQPDGSYQSGVFSPIIERNSIVPVSRVQSYSPISDKQKIINFEIYQGESRRVADNVLLGSIDVKIPTGRKADNRSVEVRFTYDINGILEVITNRCCDSEERAARDNAGVVHDVS